MGLVTVTFQVRPEFLSFKLLVMNQMSLTMYLDMLVDLGRWVGSFRACLVAGYLKILDEGYFKFPGIVHQLDSQNVLKSPEHFRS